MKQYYALSYDDLVNDFVNQRIPFREEHLRLARESHARGELQLAGALADPADGALLVFRAESSAVAEAFANTILMCKTALSGNGMCGSGR